MLQRIYGTAWGRKEDQDAYLKMLEESDKRDHRKLGRSLDLFHMEETAPGLVFWHPKGWVLWQQVEQYMRRVYRDNGYAEVRCPQILDKSLWERTGHWQNYRESMFTTEFLLTSLVVVLIPGTGVVFTVSTGLAQGRRASLFASLGCTLGIVPHLFATVVGLAAVMHASAMAFQLLKYAGVAYLFFLAFATWRDRGAFSAQSVEGRGARGLVIRAFLLNILNPKLTIFFLAFLPQFVEPGAASPMLQLLGLSSVFMAMTFVVFVAYGFLAHAFRTAVIDSPRVQKWLRRGFAGAFAGLGTQLALSDR